MKPLVIAIMGKDKPGLVEALAKCVYAHSGNWQGSSFAQMAGQFTGFVEVHVPENKHESLISALASIDNLTVHSVSSTTEQRQAVRQLTIEVTGNDKPGIVQELTQILNQFSLNILSFDSLCESAPNWGGQMFKAKAVVGVSDSFDEDVLQSAFEEIADDVMVDISATR